MTPAARLVTLAAAGLLAGLAACTSGSTATSTASGPPAASEVSVAGSSTTTVAAAEPAPKTVAPITVAGPDTGDVVGFEVTTVGLDGEDWVVAIADTPPLRQQGLMGVEDLGDLDGMLFVFPDETQGGFWMKDTLIALDIAFFAREGSLVDVLQMTPCVADPCPSYRPSGPYRYALEAPLGELSDLAQPASLTVAGTD